MCNEEDPITSRMQFPEQKLGEDNRGKSQEIHFENSVGRNFDYLLSPRLVD